MSINIESTQKDFYALERELVYEALETSPEGLSEEEAGRRREIFGPNELTEKHRRKRLKIFINQLKSPLIYILVAAGAVTLFLGEFGDAGVIFAAVVVNTLLGYYQENKAEEALERIKTYITERSVVVRGGREREVDTKELVPGDILVLHQGARVQADARLVGVNNLYADEAVLTGESLPEEKGVAAVAYGTPLADRTSMVYSGSTVTEGSCKAIVTKTGMSTEIGKIAKLVGDQEKDETPLQKAIAKFGRTFGIFIAIASILLFFAGLLWAEHTFTEMFLITVAVAVAAVPEGLPITLTVVLAVGVKRLAERKGVIRKLLAAETLGSTTVILTDKTGTLTEAKMEMTGVENYGEDPDFLLKVAAVNADVTIENPDAPADEWSIVGTRHLEAAVAVGAAKMGIKKPVVEKELKPVDSLPFNAERKFSAVFFKQNGKGVIGYLGAPEVLLDASASIAEGKKSAKLTKDRREDIFEDIDSFAYAGSRVLGVAVRHVDSLDMDLKDTENLLKDVQFLGLITLTDPVRPTAKAAVEKIHGANVRTVIVTGDHGGTAVSVAEKIGFNVEDENVMSGEELDVLSSDALDAQLDRVKLFTRISPEGKLRILRAYQERSEVVAMTGDGVNDAPALKNADIGVALGSGTDVAKDVADLVILNDDFSTIVAAIEEGRKIFQNIRKSITYLMTSSFAEIVLVSGSIFAGIGLPLEAFALQILWINIFSDSFPAVSLAFEKGDDDLMRRTPRRSGGRLLDGEMKAIIFIAGLLTNFLLFGVAYALWILGFQAELLLTIVFAALGVGSIVYIFSIRHLGESIFRSNPFANKYLNAGVAVGLGMIVLAVYLPFLNTFLHTVPLPPAYWLGIVALGIVNIAFIEIVKWIFRKFSKKKN